ncbi:MAG TPA: hypothetical protein VGQ83_31255, partial [Polyangia bacterium]
MRSLVWLVCLLALPGAARAAAPPTVVVIDIGAVAAPPEARAAVEAAVEGARLVRPHPDARVRE